MFGNRHSPFIPLYAMIMVGVHFWPLGAHSEFGHRGEDSACNYFPDLVLLPPLVQSFIVSPRQVIFPKNIPSPPLFFISPILPGTRLFSRPTLSLGRVSLKNMCCFPEQEGGQETAPRWVCFCTIWNNRLLAKLLLLPAACPASQLQSTWLLPRGTQVNSRVSANVEHLLSAPHGYHPGSGPLQAQVGHRSDEHHQRLQH